MHKPNAQRDILANLTIQKTIRFNTVDLYKLFAKITNKQMVNKYVRKVKWKILVSGPKLLKLYVS